MLGDTDQDVDIAGRIFDFRMARGWSQVELGRVSGVHHVTISKLEGAQTFPRLVTLRKLAAAFNVSVRYLLDDTQPVTTAKGLKIAKTKVVTKAETLQEPQDMGANSKELTG